MKQYRCEQAESATDLTVTLNTAALEGWRPILFTSASSTSSSGSERRGDYREFIEFTLFVVLERDVA